MNSSEVLRLSNGNFLAFENVFRTSFPDDQVENIQTYALYDADGTQITDPVQLRIGELTQGEVGMYRDSVSFSIAQPGGGAMLYLTESTDDIRDPLTGDILVPSTIAYYIVTLDAAGAIVSTEEAPTRIATNDPGAVISVGDGTGLNVHGDLYKIAADGTRGDVSATIQSADVTEGFINSAGAAPLPGGGFFALGYTYAESRETSGNTLYGAFFDSDLAQTGPAIALLDDSYFLESFFGEIDDFALLRLNDGRFVIAVHTYDSADALSRVSEMTLMVLNADGTVHTPPFQANSGGELGLRQFEPELFALQDGGFALAYQAGNEFVGQIDLHVRRFDADIVLRDTVVVLDDDFDLVDPDIVETYVTPAGEILYFDYIGDALKMVQLAVGGSILPTPGQFVLGTDGPDTLLGSNGDDTLQGGEGGDLLSAGAGNDLLDAGAGDDGLQGEGGNDTLNGGEGDDSMSGSDGDDVVNGDAGNDQMGGGLGADVMNGGTGNDRMGGGQGDDTMDGGVGNDVVNGGAGDDSLNGGAGADTMGASFNNDTVDGGAGNDDMGGGAGRDSLMGSDGDDSIGGGEGDDVIDGGAGADFLAGGGRDDVIDGGTGDDTINGGAGNDTMTGGAGADLFVFNSFAEGEADLIADFENGLDSFRMTGVVGTGLQGRIDALDITDVVVDGQAGATLSYDGQVITVLGVAAADLGVEDFTFL